MAGLNKFALGAFVTAKIMGMAGVCVGFVGPEYVYLGGFLLKSAFALITCSVIASIVQMRRDRQKFDAEDRERSKLKQLSLVKTELEKEINDLEERRRALQNLLNRRSA